MRSRTSLVEHALALVAYLGAVFLRNVDENMPIFSTADRFADEMAELRNF